MTKVDAIHIPKKDEEDFKLGDEIPERYVDRATAELKNNYRIISITIKEKPVRVKIHHPTIAQELDLSEIYTQEYNKLMNKDGYMTRKQIENQLKDRGVITRLDKERLEKLQKSLTSLIEEYHLMLAEDKTAQSVLDKKRTEYQKIRDKLLEVNSENSEHYVNSIESICDHKQTFHKMVMCVKRDDKGLWSDVDELLNSNDKSLMTQLIEECLMFWSGISREVLCSLPDVLEEIYRGANSSENLQEKVGDSTSPSQKD